MSQDRITSAGCLLIFFVLAILTVLLTGGYFIGE